MSLSEKQILMLVIYACYDEFITLLRNLTFSSTFSYNQRRSMPSKNSEKTASTLNDCNIIRNHFIFKTS